MKTHTSRHIFLIGFKSVGKSVIGREMATRLQKPFYDLDRHVESLHAAASGSGDTCRQIMTQQGEDYFRGLETEALQSLLGQPPGVIALGGGTPLLAKNQTLLEDGLIIHVIAPRDVTFARILRDGLPAFFTPEETPHVAFNRLWDERETTYRRLASLTLLNDSDIQATVNDFLERITA